MPTWMLYYSLVVTIVIPVAICITINITIFIYVKSSSRRVHSISKVSSTNQRNDRQPKLSRRDIHLLRHMIFMFLVYIIGWGPICVFAIISRHISVNVVISNIVSLLAELSLLCDIVDLFLYSHELREYLQRKVLEVFYRWDEESL